jgi:hypothetical protein
VDRESTAAFPRSEVRLEEFARVNGACFYVGDGGGSKEFSRKEGIKVSVSQLQETRELTDLMKVNIKDLVRESTNQDLIADEVEVVKVKMDLVKENESQSQCPGVDTQRELTTVKVNTLIGDPPKTK